MARYFTHWSALFVLLTLTTSLTALTAQQTAVANRNSAGDRTLLEFALGYLKGDSESRYFDALVDLNGDGTNELIVHVVGRWVCGTGGCNTYIFTRDDKGPRLVTDVTLTRPPIRVLKETTNGWRSLAVQVSGGGIRPFEAELQFDGNTYEGNPSVAPARPGDGSKPGQIVIPRFQSMLEGKQFPAVTR